MSLQELKMKVDDIKTRYESGEGILGQELLDLCMYAIETALKILERERVEENKK